MADRSLLLRHLAERVQQRGFEIGPLVSPFLSKTESDVLFVDRLSNAELRTAYGSDPNVDIARLVDIDVALGENTICERLGHLGPFDYAIASHVIEHVPNVIGWLADIADLLRVGGRLVLVVPDKRYTFDYLRETSTLASMIEASLGNYRRPSPGQIFDFFAYAANVDKAAAWRGELDRDALQIYAGLHAALHSAQSSRSGQTYPDCHCWVFTPESMLKQLAALAELRLLHFELAFFIDTQPDDLDFGLILERVPECTDTAAAGFRRQASLLRPQSTLAL